MGTERRLALLALAVAAAGCSNVNRCRSQTILVSIALDATAAQSDTLAVDVAVDGSSNRTLVTHAPGSGAGTIEVRFPSGYPTGKTVAITIVALQGGNSIGTGTTTVVPPSGCATAALAIAGTTAAGEDLSMAQSDLSTVDLSMVQSDLSTVDLSMVV
ncbi:MAG: hypothetical protein JWM53_694, partial [bacterium]|nr:hypothetical protein [bacterium]